MLPGGISGGKSIPEAKTQMTFMHLQLISPADEGLTPRLPV